MGCEYEIVVLDVGKTNKKLFVYDSRLRCLNPEEQGVEFAQVERDGLLADDLASICEWMLGGLRRAASRFDRIRCISITTHGATIALLGREPDRQFAGDGGLVFPVVSYEQEIEREEDEDFYASLGMTPEEMQRLTGTPRFGWLLNPGKQVYWLQRRFPERFAEVTDILMLPQYLGYLLTGEKGVEPTYLGCHGYLLDIDGQRYSIVAEKLGLLDKLPALPFRHPWEPLGRLRAEVAAETGLAGDCLVTLGVHDSNAALVPYFVRGSREFVVQDSGTWVVTMSPRDQARFAEDELGREVFFNRSIFGDPVKTTSTGRRCSPDSLILRASTWDSCATWSAAAEPSVCPPWSGAPASSPKAPPASKAWTSSSVTRRRPGASLTWGSPSRATRPSPWRPAPA